MPIQDILAQYPLPIAIAIYALVEAIKILLRKSNATVQKTENENRQDDTITNFSVEFNAERRALQESLTRTTV